MRSKQLSHSRRSTAKSVNYNEKDADETLLKLIEANESEKDKKSKHNNSNRKSNKNQVDSQDTGIKSGRGVYRRRAPGRPPSSDGTSSGDNSKDGNKKKYQKLLGDRKIPWNLIPTMPASLRKQSQFSQILELDDAVVDLKLKLIKNKDSVLLRLNNTIYMISEPPGEPYYIGRIMNFVPKAEYKKQIETVTEQLHILPAKYFLLEMNWFYRPRDIQESSNRFDSRLVYASLHEDLCPINSYRGHCTVLHINDLKKKCQKSPDYLSKPNVFYFEQLFDRYTLQYYKLYDTASLSKANGNSNYLHALNKRFRYVYAEENYPLKEIINKYVRLTNRRLLPKESKAVEDWDDRCAKCKEWCLHSQSLRCDECNISIHLFCLDQPVDKKPNKGIVWLCFNCANIQDEVPGAEDMQKEEEEIEKQDIEKQKTILNQKSSTLLKTNLTNNAKNWWFQYLGQYMINHLEDSLEEKLDFPYPLKPSRVGNRYQWSQCIDVSPWEPKRYQDESNSDERGLDDDQYLLWKYDEAKLPIKDLEAYILKCKKNVSPMLGIIPESVNFLDAIVETLVQNNYDTQKSFDKCEETLSREYLKEPTFTDEEIEKFENGIREHGSELHPVWKLVGTQPMSMIVRFYYNWKKTPNGRDIWGNYKGRSKNKTSSKSKNPITGNSTKTSTRIRKPSRILLESRRSTRGTELKYLDDSSLDVDDMDAIQSIFKCVFCASSYSPMWYRVTGGIEEDTLEEVISSFKKTRLLTDADKSVSKNAPKNMTEKSGALCIRCARLWRRYAVKWDQPLDVFKEIHGTRASTLQLFLDDLFDDTSDTLGATQLSEAREKLVEWELVQDAELITKQRLKFYDGDGDLNKQKNTLLSSHSKLYALVKKPYDEKVFAKEFMTAELESLISKLKRPKQSHTLKSKNVLEKSKEKKTAEKTAKRSINFFDQDNSKTAKTQMKVRKVLTKKQELPQEFKYIKFLEEKYAGKVNQNGTININLNSDNNKKSAVSVDLDFENIYMDNSFLDSLSTSYRNQIDEEVSIPENKTTRKEPISTTVRNGNDKLDELPFFSNRVPIVHQIHDTASKLNSYHQFNMPKLRTDIYQVEIGRKSIAMKMEPKEESLNKIQDSCNVCDAASNLENDKLIKCYNCSLKVHPTCYGLTHPIDVTKKNMFLYKWLCDPCSNDLNPIVSTSYRCCLCKLNENIIIDNDMNGIQHIPRALKTTIDGSWCHLICAILDEHTKFGNTDSLQPIVQYSGITVNHHVQCNICLGEGGSFHGCTLCDKTYHSSCAVWSNKTNVYFRKQIRNESDVAGTFALDKHMNQRIFLQPVILCKEHGIPTNESYFAFSDTIGDRNENALSVFIKYNKQAAPNSISCLKYQEQMLQKKAEDVINDDSTSNAAKEELDQLYIPSGSAINICICCGKNASLHWHQGMCLSCQVRKSHLSKLNKEQLLGQVGDDILAKYQLGLPPQVMLKLLNDFKDTITSNAK